MEVRHLKLVFYSTKGSGFKSFSLNRQKIISLCFLLLLSYFGITGVSAYLSLRYHEGAKVSRLQRQNGILISQISAIESKTKNINDRLERLEQFDNDLRILADLPEVDEDIRSVGVGGLSFSRANTEIDELPTPLNSEVHNITSELAELDRRIELEFASYGEILDKLRSEKRKVRHTPSIAPVDGLLKSPFGNRVDPFEDVIRHHDGIDIAAVKGTSVRTPADGVIIAINTDNVRKGYGRFVLVDHGDGVKTLFGHLSKVSVKRRQKIKRRDIIGEVGRTGRATGYHLHYEVIVKGKKRDPYYFIHDK